MDLHDGIGPHKGFAALWPTFVLKCKSRALDPIVIDALKLALKLASVQEVDVMNENCFADC